jgi:hypothetical protein
MTVDRVVAKFLEYNISGFVVLRLNTQMERCHALLFIFTEGFEEGNFKETLVCNVLVFRSRNFFCLVHLILNYLVESSDNIKIFVSIM